MAVVALTTDFGTTDPFVGIMKGVILARAPGTTLVDVSHGIPPQAVAIGALVLAQAVPWFPPHTIHVAVVDPGVGGARRPVCVETKDALLVGPDNGLLSLAAPPERVRRVVHLTDERFLLSPRSGTFHGRDVFAPVAAALAAGTPATRLGPEVHDLARLALPVAERDGDVVRGQVLYADHFGNLTTNVRADTLGDFPRSGVSTTLRQARIRGIASSYDAVAPGELVAVVNSWGFVEIAVRDGSARDAVGARVGEPVRIEGR
jgi:S-adenosyl-L-methionine hydrolase (adenosine-forming)